MFSLFKSSPKSARKSNTFSPADCHAMFQTFTCVSSRKHDPDLMFNIWAEGSGARNNIYHTDCPINKTLHWLTEFNAYDYSLNLLIVEFIETAYNMHTFLIVNPEFKNYIQDEINDSLSDIVREGFYSKPEFISDPDSISDLLTVLSDKITKMLNKYMEYTDNKNTYLSDSSTVSICNRFISMKSTKHSKSLNALQKAYLENHKMLLSDNMLSLALNKLSETDLDNLSVERVDKTLTVIHSRINEAKQRKTIFSDEVNIEVIELMLK